MEIEIYAPPEEALNRLHFAIKAYSPQKIRKNPACAKISSFIKPLHAIRVIKRFVVPAHAERELFPR
jgi:hypothetical protein